MGRINKGIWVGPFSSTDRDENTTYTNSYSGGSQESGSSSRSESSQYSSSLNSSSSASGSSTQTYSASGSTRSFSVSASQNASFSGSGNSSGSFSYSNSNGGTTSNGNASGNTSLSTSASFSENVAITGTDDNVFVSANGNLTYNGTYRDSSSGSGSSTSDTESLSSSSRLVINASGSGNTTYQASSSNGQSASTGSFSSSTNGSRLAASQVTGTRKVSDGDGGTTRVPFRGNETTGGAITVSSSGVYSYRQTGGNTDSQSSGVVTRKTSGDSRSSSYTGITGEYEGFSLGKSQGSGNRATVVQYTNDNGDLSLNGSFFEETSGSSDSLSALTSSNTSGNTSTTSSSRSNSGSNSSTSSQGTFSEDSSGSSQQGTGNSTSQGTSSSTSTTTRITSDADSFSFSTGTTSTKARTNGSGEGSSQYKNGVLQNQITTSQGDSSSRVNTSGNSFNTSSSTLNLPFGVTVTTFSMEGSGGSSRANNNSGGTETTRRSQDETTSRGDTDSDYSASQRGSGFSQTTVSTRGGSTTIYVTTTSSGSSNSSTEGDGSGTTRRDADSNDYDYQVNSSNSGNTSGKTSITTGRRSANSGSSVTIARTDSAGGESSFNGDVSRTGDRYSRSGEVTRKTDGSAEIELTLRSNSKSGNTRSWTSSTWGIESSQEFSLDGQLTEKNGSSTLAGDAMVSNTSGSSGSETAGNRKTLSGGYEQSTTTNGNSSSLTKTTSGSVTIKNGETNPGKQSYSETTKNTDFVERVIENRNRTGDNVTRNDRTTKLSNTISNTITDGGDPKQTEERALDETIKTYGKTVSGSTGNERVVINTTDVTQNDTTSYSLQGSKESLSLENEKTTVAKRKVKNGGYFRFVSVSDYTTTTTTESKSSYSSIHTIGETGLVSGGKLESSGSDSREFTIIGSGNFEGQTDGDSEFAETTRKTNLDYESSISNSYNEMGSYRDSLIPLVGVLRVSSGTYWEESSSSSKTKEAKSVNKLTHPNRDEDTTKTSEDSSHQKRRIEGTYGPLGGSEKTTENSRNWRTRTSEVVQIHSKTDDPDFDGKRREEITRGDESQYRLDEAPTGRDWWRRTMDVSGDSDNGGSSTCNFHYSSGGSNIECGESTDPFENATAIQQGGERDTGPSTGGVFSFATGQAGSPQLQLIADGGGDTEGLVGTLPPIVVRPPVRQPVGETEMESGWGAFSSQIQEDATALATGIGNSIGNTLSGVWGTVKDPIGTLREIKDTAASGLYNLLTRNPADNARDVAAGVGNYFAGKWEKGFTGLGELIGDAAQAAAGGVLSKKLFGVARKAPKVTTKLPAPKFKLADFTGRVATTPPHLPAGKFPALVVDGKVYVARFHIDAWELAGKKGVEQFYGFAEIDAAGNVVKLLDRL